MADNFVNAQASKLDILSLNMTLNIAWLGTGHIHTPGFVNETVKRGYTCAGVWDHNQERAEANAKKLSGQVVDLESLTNQPNVDGFIICSETVHHLDLVKKAAGMKKPIFIEKPMGFSGAQSLEILKILSENEIVFQTGYFMRGIATVRTLKNKVDEGFFGTITRVRASNCHSGALGGWFDTDWRWMADRSQSGVGAFGDLGTHVLDLLMYLIGDVKSATGALSMGTARYEGCDEFGEALLTFNNGALGTIAAGWNDVADPVRIQIAGTRGHALLGNTLQLAGPDGKLEEVSNLASAAPAGINAFFDFLEGKPSDLVTASEAAKRDVVMSAIYKGAESNSWVNI